MNKSNFLLAVVCTIVTVSMGCRFKNRNDIVRAFIPGVYERIIDDSTGAGTVRLEIQPTAGNGYVIRQVRAVTQQFNGRLLPMHTDTIVSYAVFDEQHRVLQESRRRRLLLFVPEENRLLIGGTAYRKLK